ncbi:hypothetical protein ACQ4PT_025231 [Festuca glaucescens]
MCLTLRSEVAWGDIDGEGFTMVLSRRRCRARAKAYGRHAQGRRELSEEVLAAVVSPAVSARPLKKPAVAVEADAPVDLVQPGPVLDSTWGVVSPLPRRHPPVAGTAAEHPSSSRQPPLLDDAEAFPLLPSVHLQGICTSSDASTPRSSAVGDLSQSSSSLSSWAVRVGDLLIPLPECPGSPDSASPPPSPRELGFSPRPSPMWADGPAQVLEAQSARSSVDGWGTVCDGRHVSAPLHPAVEAQTAMLPVSPLPSKDQGVAAPGVLSSPISTHPVNNLRPPQTPSEVSNNDHPMLSPSLNTVSHVCPAMTGQASPSPGHMGLQAAVSTPGSRSPVLAEIVSRAWERRSKSNFDRPARRQASEALVATQLQFDDESEAGAEPPAPLGLHHTPAIRPDSATSSVPLLQVSPVLALGASVARAPRSKATPVEAFRKSARGKGATDTPVLERAMQRTSAKNATAKITSTPQAKSSVKKPLPAVEYKLQD